MRQSTPTGRRTPEVPTDEEKAAERGQQDEPQEPKPGRRAIEI